MARKPDFFNYAMSLYEVVTPQGLMRPVLAARKGGLYCGGRCGTHARGGLYRMMLQLQQRRPAAHSAMLARFLH